jgi:alkylation response protein AidB-like acyl-CoA dehydrogenase
MELDLSPDDAAFRQHVRAWFDAHLVGEFAEHPGLGTATGVADWDLQLRWERELAAAGLLSIRWPIEYGGQGGTLNQELVFLMEFARVRAPYWVGVHGRDLFGPTLLRFGTPEQKARFLPPITRAEEFWGQGFSEPDAGSDLAGLRTRAERRGDEWIVNGHKIWMSLGMHADWLYVLCRTDPDAPAHAGISLLMVPRHQPGVDIRPIRNLARDAEFCEVFFDDARTDADLVVGGTNNGWQVAMGTLGTERVLTTLPAQLGFPLEMQALREAVVARKLGTDPVVRQQLVNAWIGLRVQELILERNLATIRAGGDPGFHASLAKLSWAGWHRSFGETAMNLLGPDAMLVEDEYGLTELQRIFLESRAETIYGGASEIQRNIVGERILGLPREPR